MLTIDLPPVFALATVSAKDGKVAVRSDFQRPPPSIDLLFFERHDPSPEVAVPDEGRVIDQGYPYWPKWPATRHQLCEISCSRST